MVFKFYVEADANISGNTTKKKFWCEAGSMGSWSLFFYLLPDYKSQTEILDADSSPTLNQENYEANLTFSNYPVITNVYVIRFLTGVSAGSGFDRGGKIIEMVVINLTSHRGYKNDCALFGDFVDQLNGFIAIGDL